MCNFQSRITLPWHQSLQNRISKYITDRNHSPPTPPTLFPILPCLLHILPLKITHSHQFCLPPTATFIAWHQPKTEQGSTQKFIIKIVLERSRRVLRRPVCHFAYCSQQWKAGRYLESCACFYSICTEGFNTKFCITKFLMPGIV